VVGVEPQGIIEAFLEAGQRVAGEAVHEVEAENDPRLVQQIHPGPEIVRVEGAPQAFQDRRMGALKADLEEQVMVLQSRASSASMNSLRTSK